MSFKTIKVNVFRFDPSIDDKPRYQIYDVPFEEGRSALDYLDDIYQHQDGTLAYYDHAGCSLGICGRCTGRINGKPGLFCQSRVEGDITLEPLAGENVLRDLVSKKDAAAQPHEVAAQERKKDMTDINSVPTLIRREIEALVAVPLIKAFISEYGREPALKIAEKVIQSLGLEAGALLKAASGGSGMEHLRKALPMFGQNGALEITILETTPDKAAINVTRCKYAEMYREHGLQEFGFLLSCGRDFALMHGFNPGIRFTRTQTIMEGAAYCDFRFSLEEE